MAQALRVVEQLRLLRDRTRRLSRAVGGVEPDLEPGGGGSLERALQRRLVALGVAVVRVLLAREEEAGRAAAAFGVEHLRERVGGVPAANGIQREGHALTQVLLRALDDPAAELARGRPRSARTEQVDVVRERHQEPLAARIAAPLHAEPLSQRSRQLGDARARRARRRKRPAVGVEPRLPLRCESQQPEHLVELLRLSRRSLVERQPERIQQRVERVPPLRLH